jgi:hypothetical protein
MEALKQFLAIICFIIGAAFFSSIIFDVFSWFEFIGGISCLVLAYFMWPSKKRGQRQSDNLLLDILEFLIELPFEVFGGLFRFLGRIFRSKDGCVGVDIDL